MKKTLALILALLMMVSLFAGCGQSEEPAPEATPEATPEAAPEVAPEATPEAAPAEEINYLRLQWAPINETFSGFYHPSKNWQQMFNDMIWDTLMDYDMETSQYVPTLAESYTISPDSKTWTVTLKDAKWHDGEPVVAEDVVMSFQMYVAAAGGESSRIATLNGYDAFVAGEADNIAGLIAKDDKTVVFEFAEPRYGFEETLACNAFAIMPSHILGDLPYVDATVEPEYWASPVGTGPYKINEIDYPNYVTLTRNDDYHGPKAGIKDILLLIVQDANARATSVMAGEVHMDTVASVQVAETILEANPDFELMANPSNYHQLLFTNMGDAEGARDDLKNVKIRQALASIIDKETIAEYLGPNYLPATTMSTNDAYNTNIPEWTRGNPEEVKKVLEEEGFDFDTPIRLLCTYADTYYFDVLEIVRANLAEVGVSSEVVPSTGDAMADVYENVIFDYWYGGMGGRGVSPYTLLVPGTIRDIWFTEEIRNEQAERYGKLVDAYNNTNSAEERADILNQIQENFVEDQYLNVLYCSTGTVVKHKDFTGFVPQGSWEGFAQVDFNNWALAE